MEEGVTRTKSVDGVPLAARAFVLGWVRAIIACPLGRRLPVIVQMAEVVHLVLVSKVASMVVIAGFVGGKGTHNV